MRLHSRLLIIAILPLIFSTVIIGLMIGQLLSLQSSAKADVQILLKVEELQGEMIIAKQALSNYTFNATDANKLEALQLVEKVESNINQLSGFLREKEHIIILDKVTEKFEELSSEVHTAFQQDNKAVIKRQSIRISGVLNDMHLLEKRTNEWYESLLVKTEKKIQFAVTFSIIGSLLLIIVSGLLSWILAKRITKPLNELVNQAVRVADGDLTISLEELDAKENSKYEIDQLKQAFSFMITNLKKTIQSIELVGDKVNHFTNEVSSYMDNLQESSTQVAVSTEELAKGSQAISEDIQSTANLMGQMNEQFEDVHDKTSQSSEASLHTLDSVIKGRLSLEKQGEIAKELLASSKQIKMSVEEFAQFTGQIEGASKSVREIAEQTNLLALNAAIEAARAGEAGKGFAVVAEEVRKLADDSTKATHLISTMVTNIKNGITSIVEATELGHQLSSQQEQNMNDTEASFETILEHVSAINLQLNTLLTTVTDSKEMSSQVISSVENISAVTEETAAGTEEISASTDAQLSSFEQVNEKVGQLRTLTEEMKVELGRFRV